MNLINNFNNISNQIDFYTKLIVNGGYDKRVSQLIDKSNLDTSLNILEQNSSSNNSIINISKQAQLLLNNVNSELDKFKELTIKYLNNTIPNNTSIKLELNSIKKSIEENLNFRNEQGYIFSGTKTNTKPFIDNNFNGNFNDIYLITSSNSKSIKIYSPDFLKTPDGNILQSLTNIINDLDNESNLEKLQSLKENISIGITKYAINDNNAEKRNIINSNMKISTQEFYENKYNHLEEYIKNLNDSLNQYKSMSFIFNKTKDLSLINYI